MNDWFMDDPDSDGETTLGRSKTINEQLNEVYILIKNESIEELSDLLDEHHEELINFVQDYYPSLLHEACKCKSTKAPLHLLLSYFKLELDLNKESEEGTPLAVACCYGNLEIVHMLISLGVPCTDVCFLNNSPLCSATLYGHIDIVEILMKEYEKKGMLDVFRTSEVQQLLIYYACVGGHLDLVKYWVGYCDTDLNSSISSDSADPEFRIPLLAALSGEKYKIVDFLLSKGAIITKSITETYGEMIYKYLHSKPVVNYENVEADWSRKGLTVLPKHWINSLNSTLKKIDLSHNNIETIENFSCQTLIFSSVLHKDIPMEKTKFYLEHLNMSYNNLDSLPIQLLQIPSLKILDVSANKITKIADNKEEEPSLQKQETCKILETNCPSLKYLNLSYNYLTHLPREVGQLKSLKQLELVNNEIENFIDSWACPLKTLNLSENKLTSLPELRLHWSLTLTYLDISNNQFIDFPYEICCLEVLVTLNASNNHITTLPDCDWKSIYLENLDLSNNELSNHDSEEINSISKWPTLFQKLGGTFKAHKDVEIHFPEIFQTSLKNLNLSNNYLNHVPPEICKMEQLLDLNLSNNYEIHELPLELGNLNGCLLHFDNLVLTNIPDHISETGYLAARSKSILTYLRSQLMKEIPYYQMKMMVVGKEKCGKSTLIALLKGSSALPKSSTNGVQVEDWKMFPTPHIHTNYKDKLPEINLSVWDMGGHKDYYVTHQCFFTKSALYLLVWQINTIQESLKSFKSWLLNIEARAPKSSIIIVLTFVDVISNNNRSNDIQSIKILLESIFNENPDQYPQILAIHEVSCKTKEGIKNLYELIYRTCFQKLEKEKIPSSYIKLQHAIKAKARSCELKKIIPFLDRESFKELVGTLHIENLKEENLAAAVNTLHESGVLLYYGDAASNICSNYYFIQPAWLCNLLAKIITVRENNIHVNSGVMNIEKAKYLFGGNSDLFDLCIEILLRFEVVVFLDNDRLLIPSKLPEESPGILLRNDSNENDDSINVIRIYKMPYIPAGFWSRLIIRLMVNIIFITKISQSEVNTKISERNSDYGFKKFQIHSKLKIFWRTGIFIDYTGGSFSIHKSDGNVNSNYEAITICVQSDIEDFSAVGFITEQIDSILKEWYPGLMKNINSEPQISYLIPCPVCQKDSLVNWSLSSSDNYYFTLKDCANQALKTDGIFCIGCQKDIPLRFLIPDLLLSDFPEKLVLCKEDLTFFETPENCLGIGGSALVYKGMYKNKEIAIKQFHSVNNQMDQPLPDLEMCHEACNNLQEMCKEVTILHMLNHPCIVSLVGFSIRPLCFALEMAPCGSLADVFRKILEEKYKKKSFSIFKPRGLILSRCLTFKIVWQVISALAYLHRLGIIYRDLKCDNVLVWSCNMEDVINIKLSDYGISKVCAPNLKILGREGTPGFLAPEIIKGQPYNEKVDIFSFAMVIYEIISGFRPYHSLNYVAEINKKTIKNIRPSLENDKIETDFPALEDLMKICWNDNAYERPSASEIVKKMSRLDFYFLCKKLYIMSANKNQKMQIFVINSKKSKICICQDCDDGQNLSIYDVEQETYLVKNSFVPKIKIMNMIEIYDLGIYWIFVEDHYIKAAQRSENSINLYKGKHKLVDCVECILAMKQNEEYAIFIGFANGIVTCFKNSYTHEKKLHLFKSWKKQDIRTFENNNPVNTILFIEEGNTIWANNKDQIVVINVTSLEILKRFPITSEIPSSSKLICVNDSVWCIGCAVSTYFLNIYNTINYSTTDITYKIKQKEQNIEKLNLGLIKKPFHKSLEEISKKKERRHSTSSIPKMNELESTTEKLKRQNAIKRSNKVNDSIDKNITTLTQECKIVTELIVNDTLWILNCKGMIDIIKIELENENRHSLIDSIDFIEQPAKQLAIFSDGSIASFHFDEKIQTLILMKWNILDQLRTCNHYKMLQLS